MVKIIKKSDIFLISIFILLSISLIFMFISFESRHMNSNTIIYIFVERNLHIYGNISSFEGQTIDIIQENNNINSIFIKNGAAIMIYSNCRDLVCMNRGVLSSAFQPPIVCLPNQVVVEFRMDSPVEFEFDVIISKRI